MENLHKLKEIEVQHTFVALGQTTAAGVLTFHTVSEEDKIAICSTCCIDVALEKKVYPY